MDRPNTKRLDRKIVRLAECISILPLPTETCPKNNMAAFYVETNDRSYVFATDKQESSEWITKLCEIAFPNIPNDLNKAKMPESEGGETDVNVMQMAVNSIYFSREEGLWKFPILALPLQGHQHQHSAVPHKDSPKGPAWTLPRTPQGLSPGLPVTTSKNPAWTLPKTPYGLSPGPRMDSPQAPTGTLTRTAQGLSPGLPITTPKDPA
ncbi:hypothetical protein NDU88_007548 [Pleurodeles waltl]|uniref:PH domain-containing protein n=1 Tax=Pleurodeles waltl TaxID=8319 RepID=A0AAV7WGX6_PLEWA|nr:hypothetical protein NDU88_007548 [Pleurodeles waltl]